MTVSTYQRPGDIAITDDATAREWMRRCDAAHHVFERRLGWFAAHQVRVGSPQPDMAVELEAGNIFDPGLSGGNATLTELSRQIVGGFTAPAAGMVRIDRVVVDAITGVASRIAGTAQTGTRAWVYSATDPRYVVAGSPTVQPPAIPWGKLPVCQVLLGPSDTAITDAMIIDERAFRMLNMVDAADFDGTNDNLLRGGGLTGASDSKLVTFVAWIKPVTWSNGLDYVLDLLAGFTVRAGASNSLEFLARESTAAALNLIAASDNNAITVGAWNCIMFSADMSDTAKRHMYVGDTDVQNTWTTYDDLPINFTVTEVGVGSTASSTNRYDGDQAEVVLATGVYTDFSIEANRRKVIDANGRPVFLGHDGSRLTGTAPIIYLGLRNGEAVANFAVNRGTGGDFSITGALAAASTSPSD